MNNPCSRLAAALALCLPLPATAQSGPPDAADPKAPAPALRYRSAFADYKPWQDTQPGNWRALNDALAPTPASAAGRGPAAALPADKASAPAAAGHHGQHMHMHGGRR